MNSGMPPIQGVPNATTIPDPRMAPVQENVIGGAPSMGGGGPMAPPMGGPKIGDVNPGGGYPGGGGPPPPSPPTNIQDPRLAPVNDGQPGQSGPGGGPKKAVSPDAVRQRGKIQPVVSPATPQPAWSKGAQPIAGAQAPRPMIGPSWRPR